MTLTKSQQMARVKSRDTEPELLVRRLLWSAGVRYRLHSKDLPGRPDVYIPRLHLAIFVNGCFWHGHGCSKAGRLRTNVDFWSQKIASNVARDAAAKNRLNAMGVNVLVLWTCDLHAFSLASWRIARRYRRAAR